MRFAAVFFLILSSFASPLAASDISGRALFSGPVPEPQKIDMKADPACAKLHSKPVFSGDAAVGKDGALKNVFVYVKKGLEGKTFDPPQTPVQLVQEGCLYTPRVFGLQTGQPLQMTNKDKTLHNVRASAKTQKDFNLGMPMQGMTVKKQFAKPEVMVPFKCDVHPWMKAYAGVLAHPFFAVTDETGAFKISGLPAGEYTLEAWHEKFGTRTLNVTVSDGTETPAQEFQFSAA